MAGQRIALFDNAKGYAILIVAIGHFTSSAVGTFSDFQVLNATNAFIWSYHIPLFIFCSGLFAGKSWYKRKTVPWDKFMMYLAIYLLFWLALVVFKALVCNTYNNLNPLFMEKAPWFMLVLALYMVAVPLIGTVKPAVFMPISIVLAVVAGIYNPNPDLLSSGRFMVYLPYFAAGFYLQPDRVSGALERMHARIGKTQVHAIGIAALVVAFVVFMLVPGDNIFKAFAAGRYTLPFLMNRYHLGMAVAVILRLATYVVGTLMIAVTLMALPYGECVLTKWGQRSLQIYFIHIFVLYTANRFGLWAHLAWIIPQWACVASAYLIGIALTWLIALPAAPQKWIAALGSGCKKLAAKVCEQ